MNPYEPDALEREVLAQWEREGTFAASLKQREHRPPFSFYDGPPYATGSPHYGHLLQSTIKDAVVRYWTMRGYRVDRRVGWDCHGLPVEHLVEKELGIKNKQEIETYGIEKFNAVCRASVFRSVDEFVHILRRLGRWADYTQAYATLDPAYMESVWWVFKEAWDAGCVSHGFRSSPYCPRCATPLANFEAALGYREVDDPAITVKLRLADAESTFLLVWTTTPWTLPANVAAAVHPDLRYVNVAVGDEHWILAKDRLPDVVDVTYRIEEEVTGSQLVGRTYEPLYDFAIPEREAYRVVAAPFVSAAEGTGIVHIAPAFGEEDLALAQTEDLPILQTVNDRGEFVDAVTPWAGMFVKEADAKIIADLEQRNLVVRREVYRHQYPFCWRCETPLLYYATHSWFITVSRIREQMLKNAEKITWVPEHLKEGRFGQGLHDAPDWAVSRSRYWGTPIPIWVCTACGVETAIGSIAELKERGADLSPLYARGGEPARHASHAERSDADRPASNASRSDAGGEPDLHRPYIDALELPCPKCGKPAKRIPEVFDVWMDSGAMPYAQWHYPFENKAVVEHTFPADFIGEGLDQTRGWFYTLHVLATILTLRDRGLGIHKPAFTHAIATGLVLGEDGRKLSKHLKNYPDPSELLSKYGADTLRLYLLSTRLGSDTTVSDRLVGELTRRFTLLLWNVWQYYRTYGVSEERGGESVQGHDAFTLSTLNSSLALLDRWILARTAELVIEVQGAMDRYHLDEVSRALVPFVEDLSTWYVRRSRGRAEALPVLRDVLRQFSIIAAPFIPFLAEHLYHELTGSSPHLADWPAFAEASAGLRPEEQEGLLRQMRVIRDLASAGHRARAEAKIKVRQPLAEVALVGDVPDLQGAGEEGLALLQDELNVKAVRVYAQHSELTAQSSGWVWVEVPPSGKLGLNTELTEGLRAEGIVRDLIRHVQDLRKKARYRFDEEITLAVVTNDQGVRADVAQHADLLKRETLSRRVTAERGSVDAEATVTVASAEVWLGVKR